MMGRRECKHPRLNVCDGADCIVHSTSMDSGPMEPAARELFASRMSVTRDRNALGFLIDSGSGRLSSEDREVCYRAWLCRFDQNRRHFGYLNYSF